MNFKSLKTGLLAASISAAAFAQDGIDGLERVGKPVDGGITLQPASTAIAQSVHNVNTILIWLCVVFSVFVSVLLLVVIFRDRDRGKEPKRFTHNTPLEIVWTIVPVLILVVLGVSTGAVLKQQVTVPEGDIVIKATGYQWYWGYDYIEEGISFDSYMLEKEDLEEYGYTQDEYLLATDNAVVVPVGKTVIVEITGADVIHSWKIPAFAVQADAVPGRTLIQHFKAEKEGLYFGQCSELCGKAHAFMPITLKVVSQEAYDNWLVEAKEKFASAPATIKVASN